MKRWVSIGLVALALAGCATGSGRPASPHRATVESPSPGARVAGGVVSVLGTPIFVALKTVVCVATVAIAAPAAAILSLSEVTERQRFRQGLNGSVAKNCGPPWVLTVREAG